MRNLKKFLALALAMVMAFSLMLTANATNVKKTYTDSEQITKEFTEAVDVLTGLGVFQGDEEAPTLRPASTITRAEVATIIYRMATGDVDGNQVNIYADYGNFADVAPTDWFAGAVGYCANAEYIKGHDGYFNPYDAVTGYEALAMILRAVGYDQNHEFEGASWQTRVASLARELGVTDNVRNANFETTLSMAARRDVVADLLFQTAVLVPTVTYTPALAYNDKTTTMGTEYNSTLGQRTFGLWKAIPGKTVGTVKVPGHDAVVDMWGRPGYWWVKDGSKIGVEDDGKPIYAGSANNPLGTVSSTDPYSYPKVIATIFETPKLTYTTQIKECDLAHDYEIATQKDFSLYVNDDDAITDSYRVVATDTVTPVGGQGRLTEVYSDSSSHKDARVVMIDTYLAKVTKTTDAVLDAAGHVIVPAKMDMVVYDGVDGNHTTGGAYAAPGSVAANAGTVKTISKPDNSAENWTYSAGDMILLNAYTLKQFPTTTVDKTHDLVTGGPATETQKNKAAYEDNPVFANKTSEDGDEWDDYSNGHTLRENFEAKVLGTAKSTITKQGTVYYNQNKHSVGGTDTPDAMLLYKDEAKVNTTSDWAWYFDQYGNVIGIDSVTAVQYGVITDLWASFGQGTTGTDGTEKIMANVTMANGDKTTFEISRFVVTMKTPGAPPAITDGKRILTTDAASVAVTAGDVGSLTPVYDYNTAAQEVMRSSKLTTTATDYADYGYLHVAPVASVNKDADTNNWGSTPEKTFGIIIDNMFKFTTNSDGSYTAIEVAGNGINGATGFNGLNNIAVNTTTDATHNRLFKNLGYVTVNAAGNSAAVWVDNDTKIMIYNPVTKAITCYNGVNELPGDVAITPAADADHMREVDWADTDGDGRADYLYLTGTIEGGVTYGLFYYNGGNAQWNDADKTGTIAGYLNGEAKTISFQGTTGKAMFDKLLNAANGYGGRLFGLQLTSDVVTNLMARSATGGTEAFLSVTGGAYGIATTTNSHDNSQLVTTSATGSYPGGVNFVAGTAGGNPYSTNTMAIYIKDINDNSTGWDLVYNRTTRQIRATASNGSTDLTFTVTANTKVIGNLDYLDSNATTAWISDVTIVYEPTNIWAIDEIYITTQPTVTPGTTPAARKTATIGVGLTTGSVLDENNNVIGSNTTVTADANDKITVKVVTGTSAPTVAPNGCSVTLISSDTATGTYVYEITVLSSNGSESVTFSN